MLYVNLCLETQLSQVDVFISGGCLVAVRYISPATRGVAPRTSPFLVSIAMIPRRNSTNSISDPASPQSMGDSVGDRRPLSLVTSQQPFRASTAQTVETESPQSETSPHEIPPMPPRPPAVGGLKRQSTRRNTYESYSSTLEEHPPLPSRPPNIPPMSMPTPPVPRTPGPPPTSSRPQWPAPGGGVGGFSGTPSPRHGSSGDRHHHNTTDYAYRFDSMPSPHSDSGPPHYESEDISGGIHANVWPTYNKISQEFDEKRLAKWNSDLDVLLIFVSVMAWGVC